MKFGLLTFEIENNKINLVSHGGFSTAPQGFAEVQIGGENKPTHLGVKTICTSESKKFKYVSHELLNDTLVIKQRSDKIEVKTYFQKFENTNALKIYTEATNVTDEEIIIEEVSAFVLKGLFSKTIDEAKKLRFTRFVQSHHAECQPRTYSFFDLGMHRGNSQSQRRIAFTNIGSQSTKEELPQGIIEDENGNAVMFQIESDHSWYYEVGDFDETYYLGLGSANIQHGGWAKKLNAGETYKTVNVALSFGASVNEAIGEMTKYRRQITRLCESDRPLPVIFNEYMYLCWDSPSEENTKRIAPIAKRAGAEYYVIDCGWHDEVDGSIIYPYVGKWQESNARYPNGVRATTDYIRSLGMKAGLWIEPEIVGVKCEEMIEYYGDECFLKRLGKKVAVGGRYFLDYRKKKVCDYMSETIRRMVEEYGADYIKFDYNQDMGIGTDDQATTFGEGLESAANAYLSWVEEMTARFPQVIFENCASGGMRLDYQSLSRFSLTSTSDCTNYLNYPYIVSNLFSAVLPEQAGVWSYPVAALKEQSEITDERVIVNMVNCLLGRIHLASDLSLLSEKQLALVKEGVECYRALASIKKRALPFMPLGFAKFGDETVASGLIDGDEIYLSVWNLSKNTATAVRLGKTVKEVKVLYPQAHGVQIGFFGEEIRLDFPSVPSAALVKVRI